MLDMYTYFGLLLLSLGCWALKFRRLALPHKLLGAWLLVTAGLEGFTDFLLQRGTLHLSLSHMLIPVQYLLLAPVYYLSLKGPTVRAVILASVPLFLLTVLLITLYRQTAAGFDTYARLLRDSLLAGWALLYFREVFQGLAVQRLEKEPMFWVSTGLLFYSLGNVCVDGMSRLLPQHPDLALAVYYSSVFLRLSLQGTILVSFLIPHKQPSPLVYAKPSRMLFP